MTKRSNALHHVVIPSVAQTVDEAMALVPPNFDVSQPENRAKVRDWMIRVCGVAIQNHANAASAAATRAIEEAAAIAIDPNHFKIVQKRRERQQQRIALRAEVERQKRLPSAMREFEKMTEAKVRM